MKALLIKETDEIEVLELACESDVVSQIVGGVVAHTPWESETNTAHSYQRTKGGGAGLPLNVIATMINGMYGVFSPWPEGHARPIYGPMIVYGAQGLHPCDIDAEFVEVAEELAAELAERKQQNE